MPLLLLHLKSFASKFVSSDSKQKLDGVIVPLAIMAIGAAINFFMFVLIARSLSSEHFSNFALWFSILSLLAAVGVAGQGNLIFRNWSSYIQTDRFDLARGSFLFGASVACAGAGAAGLTAGLLQAFSGGSIELAVSCAVFAVFFTLIYFVSPAARAISGFLSGDGNMEITWRLIAVALILLMSANDQAMSVAGVLWIMSAGLALAIGFCIYSIIKAAPKETLQSATETDIQDWRQRSVRISMANIVANVSLHIDVLVIGFFVDPLLAGGYFVAMRVANVFKRLTAAFANFASRRIAPLYFAGQHKALDRSLQDLSLVALVLVSSGLLFLILTAKWLLALFGPSYASEVWTLLVLAFGAGVTTLAGPAPKLLVHTGHETKYLSLLTIGLGLRCALLVTLTPLYGTLGAAIGATAVSIVVAILLVIACKRTVGIDPSIASLFQQSKLKLEGTQ